MWRTAVAVVVGLLVGAGRWCGPAAASVDGEIQQLKTEIGALTDRVAELEQRAETQAAVRQALQEMGVEALPNDLLLSWENGVRARTRDGSIAMKFGGRLMYDFTWIDGDDSIEALRGEDAGLDGGEVRRARLYGEAVFWKRIKFKWQYDFAEGGTVKDLYLELHNLPSPSQDVVWHLRGGHFKEPFSLEELTSSKYMTFLERALPNAFAPGRNPGFMIHGHALGKRLAFAAGIFKDAEDECEDCQFDDAQFQRDGDYTFTGRVAWVPYDEQIESLGRALVHLGGAYSYRSLDGTPRFRQRPEAHLTDRWVDTAAFAPTVGASDSVTLVGAEGAVILGPVHVAGEYLWVMPEYASAAAGRDDPTFTGWYVQVGVFLTGESRGYKLGSQTFNRSKPKKNYGRDGGLGAVELAGRYSVIDLNEEDVNGGEMRNWTVGLNWYLTPNVVVRWNYIRGDVEYDSGPEADADLFLMRLQVDF